MQILTICGNEQNQKNLLVQNKQVSFLLDQKKKKSCHVFCWMDRNSKSEGRHRQRELRDGTWEGLRKTGARKQLSTRGWEEDSELHIDIKWSVILQEAGQHNLCARAQLGNSVWAVGKVRDGCCWHSPRARIAGQSLLDCCFLPVLGRGVGLCDLQRSFPGSLTPVLWNYQVRGCVSVFHEDVT